MARGVLTIHSVTRALAPHIEWAAHGVLGAPARVKWEKQSASPTLVRTSLPWHGATGTGARLATALRGWESLHFEITEEPSGGEPGSRWMYTPSLGIHHSAMDGEGNVTLTEDRIRACLAAAHGNGTLIAEELGKALGEAWDRELDHYREAGAIGEEPRLFLVS